MIGCVSVNDAFVMDAWGKDLNVGDKIAMLADPQGTFVKELGLDFDASGMFLLTIQRNQIAVLNLQKIIPTAYDLTIQLLLEDTDPSDLRWCWRYA